MITTLNCEDHSTEHAIAQLPDQIHESFENDNYTLGFLLIYLRPLTLVTMQCYLKSLKIMELRVQILPGSKVT